MKTIGIIGGFGPETTAKFFMSLISLWQNNNQNIRPEILTWNAPVDSVLEKEFITSGKNSEHFLKLLKQGAKKLEAGGAEILVIPCNSLHIFINDIKSSTKLEVVNIIEETHKFLIRDNIDKVGLLSSGITNKFKLFESSDHGDLSIVHPGLEDQVKLDQLIHRLVLGTTQSSDRVFFIDVSKRMLKNGVRNIILGCTDFQLLKPKLKNINFIDTLDILANATIEKMVQE